MQNPFMTALSDDADALNALLSKVRNKQRADDALAISLRLAALVIHARHKALCATQILELLDQESTRFEHQAQEWH